MDDLYEKFLPQFIELARVRMERAMEAAARPELNALTVVIRELHSIAGEAGLLGLSSIMQLARRAEDQAKQLRDTRAEPDADALVGALRELRTAIELVGASLKPGGGA